MIGVSVSAGLGNRLFQIVFAFATAKKLSISFKFENEKGKHHHSSQTYDWLIQRFMELPNYEKNKIHYAKVYLEDYHSFTSYVDLTSLDFTNTNIICQGFFQNELYFKEYREDVLKLLEEPEYVKPFLQSYPKDLLDKSYFIHIRLGDYVGCSKHWVDLTHYYIRILTLLYQTDPDGCLFIFSNQINSIKNIYPVVYKLLISKPHVFVTEFDEIKNLYLMKHCRKGGICSNSTFSWWGGWLNENSDKKVYFPKKWLNDSSFTPEIYFEHSILVDV